MSICLSVELKTVTSGLLLCEESVTISNLSLSEGRTLVGLHDRIVDYVHRHMDDVRICFENGMSRVEREHDSMLAELCAHSSHVDEDTGLQSSISAEQFALSRQKQYTDVQLFFRASCSDGGVVVKADGLLAGPMCSIRSKYRIKANRHDLVSGMGDLRKYLNEVYQCALGDISVAPLQDMNLEDMYD